MNWKPIYSHFFLGHPYMYITLYSWYGHPPNCICVPLSHHLGRLNKQTLLISSQKFSSSLIIVIVLFAPSAPICMHRSWAWVTRIYAVFQIMSHQCFVCSSINIFLSLLALLQVMNPRIASAFLVALHYGTYLSCNQLANSGLSPPLSFPTASSRNSHY